MKAKYFNLLVVMMLVLIAPATITSCLQNVCAQDVSTGSATDVIAADTVLAPAAQLIATPPAEAERLFGWQNILIMVLGVFSALFATLWKRARNVITAIDTALKDGKIDKTELTNILKTWKEG